MGQFRLDNEAWTAILGQAIAATNKFYMKHAGFIKESHGLRHVLAVHRHAVNAVECHETVLSYQTKVEIQVAALLHDVDDKKYFPGRSIDEKYMNAVEILELIQMPPESITSILDMISYVSCSENGNTIPDKVLDSGSYHLLIPRWCDRLEAVGSIGVIRCYQYNREQGAPLWSPNSPRATTVDEVWEYATEQRYEAYQSNGGSSSDMISHYYDKLLHIARPPPPSIVCNQYLERMANESSKELINVCLHFGKTGNVDEEYIQNLISEHSS